MNRAQISGERRAESGERRAEDSGFWFKYFMVLFLCVVIKTLDFIKFYVLSQIIFRVFLCFVDTV